LRAAVAGEPLKVYRSATRAMRDYVHVADAAVALVGRGLFAASIAGGEGQNLVFIAATGRSWDGLHAAAMVADAIAEARGSRARPRIEVLDADDPVPAPDHALGYEPSWTCPTTFPEGLRQTARWVLESARGAHPGEEADPHAAAGGD
jgi:nucleoside-diphosphate-sugar epimerase